MAAAKQVNPQYGLRIPREKLDKFKYIAEYNGRSANKEFERLVDIQIKAFEQKFGEIVLNKDED